MHILVESNRTRALPKSDQAPGQLRIAIGSHVTGGVHAATYATNSGKWGVLVTKYDDGHVCGGPACAVKAELLAVAVAVKTFVAWPTTTLIFISCVSKTAEMLTGIRANHVIPQGVCSQRLEKLVTDSFRRLSMNFWVAEHRLTSPSTEVKAMAVLVHRFASPRDEKTALTSGLAAQLAGSATLAFAKR